APPRKQSSRAHARTGSGRASERLQTMKAPQSSRRIRKAAGQKRRPQAGPPNASRRSFMKTTAAALACAASGPRFAIASEPVLSITMPMDAPEWALLERELLHAHTDACELFFNRYFDERGFLKCFTRWGADDGPDDAIENVNDWPQVHALGGSDKIREMYRKAYEGHVRQYTLAKTVDVPFAREGMYYKEFPVMMDWQHNAEGLTVFNLMGLSDPHDPLYRRRVKRFIGFYKI